MYYQIQYKWPDNPNNPIFKKSLITISLLNNNAPDSIKNNGTAYMKICLKEIILKCNTSALGKKEKYVN